MLTELARQDQIASDLANASTPGFKPLESSQQSFGALLVSDPSTGTSLGQLPLGVGNVATTPDLEQGAVRQTGEPLDVALVGQGFLAVRTPAGVQFTRDGQLSLDANGTLTTTTGYPVLDANGRQIRLQSAKPEIGVDGTITDGGKTVTKLGVFSLANPAKVGDSFFAGQPGPAPAGTGVKQGSLESSGVDPARAMVDMIASLRAFESVQRVIRSIDEVLGRNINGAH